MVYFNLRSPLFYSATLMVTSVSWVGAGLLPLPAQASNSSVTYSETRVRAQQYALCVSSLLQLNIDEIDSANACAAALYPRDLSRCVTRIDAGSDVTAIAALGGCRRVRRPLELATCVTEISGVTTDVEPGLILDTCRRSLLPTRFSACVVGLGQGSMTLSPLDALQTCIAAGDRPVNVRPNFVPAGQPIPPTPSSLPPAELQP